MVLKYQLSPYPGLMEDMIVRIWESDSDGPGQEVYTQVLPQAIGGGHPNIQTIIASGLDLRPHRVRLHSVTSNTLLHFYEAEPRIDVVTVFTPIRFKIGDGGALTPIAGATQYTNPIFAGMTTDEFIVIRNNWGALHPVTHYTFDEPNTTINLVGADQFHIFEEWTILMQPKAIPTLVNDSVTGKWFGGFVDITANTSWSSNHLRKLIRFKAHNVNFAFDTPPPIAYAIVFQNFGPNSPQVGRILFNNAPLLWGTGTVGFIDLPLYSECAVTWDGTNYNIIYFSDTSWATSATVIQPGQIIGIGSQSFGDIPLGDTNQVITHNRNIVGDYMVFLSRRAANASTANADNDIQISWWHHLNATLKANSFNVCLGDPFSSIQNVTICYQLIKV